MSGGPRGPGGVAEHHSCRARAVQMVPIRSPPTLQVARTGCPGKRRQGTAWPRQSVAEAQPTVIARPRVLGGFSFYRLPTAHSHRRLALSCRSKAQRGSSGASGQRTATARVRCLKSPEPPQREADRRRRGRDTGLGDLQIIFFRIETVPYRPSGHFLLEWKHSGESDRQMLQEGCTAEVTSG